MKLIAIVVLVSLGCGSKSEPSAGSGSAVIEPRPTVTDPIGFCVRARRMMLGRRKCFPEDSSLKMGLEEIEDRIASPPADPKLRRAAAAACAAMLDGMMRAEQPRNCPLDVTDSERSELAAFLAGSSATPSAPVFPLVAARAALKTTIQLRADPTPAERPPAKLLIKTTYLRGTDQLVAYETPVKPGARRPAIVWIAGGFDWGIGSSAWSAGPPQNDQSASALRPEGIVLMLPALRGGSGNPGKPECFLGEVDDILAAAEHLSKRADVDPTRIYLGGHSTGGTLVLLAAASTDRFRAVFAFGPVPDPRGYGDSGCLPPKAPEAEYLARAPIEWIDSVVTPTFVIEGKDGGNAAGFPMLQKRASPAVRFLVIPGATHFSVLAPASALIAQAILADTGLKATISLDEATIAQAVARAR